MKKEVILLPENQSILVSQRRGLEKSYKQLQKCECLQTLKHVEAKLQLVQLKLEQLTSNVNISFTKHMQSFGKIIDQKKKRQNLQYLFWDMKQANESVQEKINKQIAKQQQSLRNLNEEIQSWSRMLRDIKNWKNNYNSWSSALQTSIYSTIKGHKQQNDENIKGIYSAVEEIGRLQRRMLDKQNIAANHNCKARTFSQSSKPSVGKRSSIQQNSTIYASHIYK